MQDRHYEGAPCGKSYFKSYSAGSTADSVLIIVLAVSHPASSGWPVFGPTALFWRLTWEICYFFLFLSYHVSLSCPIPALVTCFASPLLYWCWVSFVITYLAHPSSPSNRWGIFSFFHIFPVTEGTSHVTNNSSLHPSSQVSSCQSIQNVHLFLFRPGSLVFWSTAYFSNSLNHSLLPNPLA